MAARAPDLAASVIGATTSTMVGVFTFMQSARGVTSGGGGTLTTADHPDRV
jgi:hypothetical protein